MGIIWTFHIAIWTKDILTMFRVKSKTGFEEEAKVYGSPAVLALLLQGW